MLKKNKPSAAQKFAYKRPICFRVRGGYECAVCAKRYTETSSAGKHFARAHGGTGYNIFTITQVGRGQEPDKRLVQLH
jgi:hypothetical protein